MKTQTKTITALVILALYLISMVAFASALSVDATYVTLYPGEQGSVKLDVENTFSFDIEDVSVGLALNDVPFNVVGNSEKTLDDLDTDDDDSASFTLRPSTDIVPGDYSITYVVKYTNAEDSNATSQTKNGSFGIRVSARTNLDFSIETKGASTDSAIVGQQGKISLKVINKGLGEVKFVSIQVFAQGYELISTDKVYIGNVASDDSDFATYDVIFKSSAPVLSAKVEYKDFDNNDKTQIINLPVKVYTQEQALSLGLIKKPNYIIYYVIGGLLIIWFIWKKIKKARKNKKRRNGGN